MCLFSSIYGVWLRSMENNIFTQIGFIVLVGLACKNAILIVEFAKQIQDRDQKDRFTAAVEACRLRLRPILMTSFAFIFGVVPLVVSSGAGAEMRQALGTAVFFGMLGVTGFGLFLTPVFYVVIMWFKERRPKTRSPAPTQSAAASSDGDSCRLGEFIMDNEESSPAPAPEPAAVETRPKLGSFLAGRKLPSRRVLVILGAVLILIIALPKIFHAWHTVSTDDAYVNSHVTFVAPRVSGQVVRLSTTTTVSRKEMSWSNLIRSRIACRSRSNRQPRCGGGEAGRSRSGRAQSKA